MKIVKPLGRSGTRYTRDDPTRLERILIVTDKQGQQDDRNLEEYIKSNDKPKLAQWVSLFDKIAKKPQPLKQPSLIQKQFRQRLWGKVSEHLETSDEFQDWAKIKEAFELKVNCYPNSEKTSGNASAKGKLYYAFLEKGEPAHVDLSSIAQDMQTHLNEERRFSRATKDPSAPGLITHRAKAIEANTMRLHGQHRDRMIEGKKISADFSETDTSAYRAYGDIAQVIHNWVVAQEKMRISDKTASPIGYKNVADLLFTHYAKVFSDDEGNAIPMKAVPENRHGELAIHNAMRSFYRDRLRSHKVSYDPKNKGTRRQKSLVHKIPKDFNDLLKKMGFVEDNRDVAALIRTGKAIHYALSDARPHATEGSGYDPAAWDLSSLETSDYLTSSGQDKIKRNEAFVRVWRGYLGFAVRTLENWIDPEGRFDGDYTTGKFKNAFKAMSEEGFDEKLRLLFGLPVDVEDNPLQTADMTTKKAFVRKLRDELRELRNKSFHFNNPQDFPREIRCLGADLLEGAEPLDLAVAKVFRAYWDQDVSGQRELLYQSLIGVHADYFLSPASLKKVFTAIRDGGSNDVILPRFNRILARYAGAWTEHTLVVKGKAITFSMPDRPNSELMEREPARRCQYVVLKMLYEREFCQWLKHDISPKVLQNCVRAAEERSDQAAKKIKSTAIARIVGKFPIGQGATLPKLMDKISEAMATEVSVQKNYEPDKKSAEDKSAFLNDFFCDVILLAFRQFVTDKGYTDIIAMDAQKPLPDRAISRVPLEERSAPEYDVSLPWQHILHVASHLVPVSEVGRVRHQFRKWQALSGKLWGGAAITDMAEAPQPMKGPMFSDTLLRTFDLFLDMHDAKASGGAAVLSPDFETILFEDHGHFKRLFPDQPGSQEERKVPIRGLREIQRFGSLEPLKHIFESKKVSKDEVSQLLALERKKPSGKSEIAELQETRRDLREAWLKGKAKDLPDLSTYNDTVKLIADHRFLSSRVRLVDHVRLYASCMRLFGRLVDFAGIWERDMYFVILALLRHHGQSPDQIFDEKWLNKFQSGQIVIAYRNISNPAIKSEVDRIFKLDPNSSKENPDPLTATRNNLQHYNPLQDGPKQAQEERFNLTEYVNQTRQLMAYDRKLKNAVSKSIIELLETSDSLKLTWNCDEYHKLSDAKIETGYAKHLKGKGDDEPLTSDAYREWMTILFNGVTVV